jgi:hypothetical protein
MAGIGSRPPDDGAGGQVRAGVHRLQGAPPFTDQPVVAEFAKIYRERATKMALPYTLMETQAAESYTAWKLIEAAVSASSVDDKVLAGSTTTLTTSPR